MKIQELRREAYRLVNLPPDYDGPVLSPSQVSPDPHHEADRMFFEALGRAAYHFLNVRRKSK